VPPGQYLPLQLPSPAREDRLSQGLVLPTDLTNEAVLEREVLHPEIVERAIRLAIDELNARPTRLSLGGRVSRRRSRFSLPGFIRGLLEGVRSPDRRLPVVSPRVHGPANSNVFSLLRLGHFYSPHRSRRPQLHYFWLFV
jgi:hypothetical protein